MPKSTKHESFNVILAENGYVVKCGGADRFEYETYVFEVAEDLANFFQEHSNHES